MTSLCSLLSSFSELFNGLDNNPKLGSSKQQTSQTNSHQQTESFIQTLRTWPE